jgi:Ni,Fe-hydrogenase maturation factor
VNNGVGFEVGEQLEHAFAITDIELVMMEAVEIPFESFLVPPGIALGAEEGGALIVVDAVNFPAKLGEVHANFGADEAGGSCDKELHLES